MDDLIKELRLSGYGTHLRNLFIGSILYADDICLISHSCFGLQNTHPFNGLFSGTTQVSRYQKCKTNLDFTEARDSEWQWHQLHLAADR